MGTAYVQGTHFFKRVSDYMKRIWSKQELPTDDLAKQLDTLSSILERPPIIELETVNVCNAKCRFCISRLQKRNKRVIDEALFEGIIKQICIIGTQQLCICPTLGDPLLDEKIVEHTQSIAKLQNIGFIRLVTNGIAFDTFSDKQIVNLLESLDILEISVGPNPYVYKNMFGIDAFEKLLLNINRVAWLMEKATPKPHCINLCGRACGDAFEIDYRLSNIATRLASNKTISWTRKYMDWGGHIDNLPLSTPVVKSSLSNKPTSPCLYALCPHIYSDGLVGLCACAGASEQLLIGDLRVEPWSSILRSDIRLALIFFVSLREDAGILSSMFFLHAVG